MFHSVSLLRQAPLARGSCALPSVLLNNVVIIEMVEILGGRLGQRSVERVRYVINNLLHLVIVKYGDKVRKQGMSYQLRKLCQDACQCLMFHHCLKNKPQEQAAKTNMASVVSI